MFSWLVILKIVLSLADKIFDHVNRNNLLNEGALQELTSQLSIMNGKMERVKQARANVDLDVKSGGLLKDDGFKRS